MKLVLVFTVLLMVVVGLEAVREPAGRPIGCPSCGCNCATISSVFVKSSGVGIPGPWEMWSTQAPAEDPWYLDEYGIKR